MALMFAICNPQPNCMPRKPKLMFQICQKVRGGWSITSRVERSAEDSLIVTGPCRQFSLPIVQRDQRSQPRAQLAAQSTRPIPPFPVSADLARKIHARVAPQPEHILQRDDSHICHRRQHRAEHDPVDLGIIMKVKIGARKFVLLQNIFSCARAVARARTPPPAEGSVIVVAAGVGSEIATVIMRTKRWPLRIIAERKLQKTHPR